MAAARLASRALAAWITRAAIASPTLLFLSRKFSSAGRTIDSTCALTSGLLSRPLVCPWNCGSRTQTDSTAVSPSRMSSRLISIPFLTRSCVSMNRCTAVPTADEHAQLVGAAVAGRDRVDERADVLVGRLGPGQGQVAAQAVVLVLALEDERQGRDPLVVALGVDGVEEVGHAAVVAELDVRLVLLVDELDHQPLVEVGLDLEPLGDQGRVVAQRPGRSRGRA